MDNMQQLDVPGVKGKVELKGAQGLLYSVLHDGVPVKPQRGRWLLPARRGGDVEMRARGLMPGFQRLYVDGDEIFAMGAAVPTWLRVLAFAPILLVVVNPAIGAIVAILLFFMNIGLIKNVAMPLVLRAVLPVLNTVAAAFIIALLAHAVSQGSAA